MKLTDKQRALRDEILGYVVTTLFGAVCTAVFLGWALGIDSWGLWL